MTVMWCDFDIIGDTVQSVFGIFIIYEIKADMIQFNYTECLKQQIAYEKYAYGER